MKTVLIRVPVEFYNYLMKVNEQQKKDLSQYTQKPIEKVKLPVTKTCLTFLPSFNQNFIQVNLKDLRQLSIRRLIK